MVLSQKTGQDRKQKGDALDKLQDLGLLLPSGDRLSAVPLDVAMRQLDRRWDEYFRYE